MLKEKLREELKAAMRAKDEVRLRTIRSLTAALMAREIELRQGGTATLTDEQELAVVQKQAKQRRDSIEQFRAAGRDDLVRHEQEELDVIESYLPRQLGDEEIRSIVQEVIQATGATSMKEMGRVMGPVMERLRGRADGKRIQEVVRSLLSGA
jgi:uncharacterized protein YqeY